MKFKILTAKYFVVLPLIFIFVFGCSSLNNDSFVGEFQDNITRVWIGSDFWANRLQDWRINKSRLECVTSDKKLAMRTVHLLTGRMVDNNDDFEMSVTTGFINIKSEIDPSAASGFLFGVGAKLDYRAAAIIHASPGNGAGKFAGITKNGRLFIKDFENSKQEVLAETVISPLPDSLKLILSSNKSRTGNIVSLVAVNLLSGKELGNVVLKDFPGSKLDGNVALVSHPGSIKSYLSGGKAWFKNWTVKGKKCNFDKTRRLGPIIATQHTLSRNILKMTAQFMPIGNNQNKEVFLEVQNAKEWEVVSKANISIPSYTVTFRVEDWDMGKDYAFRIKYLMSAESEPFYLKGNIKCDPVKKDTIVVAGFTGNHNFGPAGKKQFGGIGQKEYDWNTLSWFPHNDLINNVKKHKPDLLFFSGDQVYESASPTQKDIEHIKLDYLYKWYLWCWAFADITSNTPTICIPDDHDVFQGNVWGAGGRVAKVDHDGGYVYSPEFVNMVQQTQTSHLPDAFDSTPIEQDISVYYTDMVYGGISFAIIEDRKWKSGPNGIVPSTKSGRPDHVINPNHSREAVDIKIANLLGERQLKFLNDWAADWRGADMKVVLSQTIFANMATHHGFDNKRLYMDFDSNGWPQSKRNKALEAIRKGFGFMLAGDQHLATIVHHGIEGHNDAGFSFCVPSIANFYPRSWKPESAGKNRMPGYPEYTGEFEDGFGNKVTVYAATNPGPKYKKEPAILHDRMPGYGIVKLSKDKREIEMECWPRFANPEKDKQYEGWPKTIKMEDNYGREAVGFLPTISVAGMENPVVQIVDEADSSVVYTIRINGNEFTPKVFKQNSYTVKVGEPGTDMMQVFENVSPMEKGKQESIQVSF